MNKDLQKKNIPPPPKGIEKIKWLGPGFLWMVSAAGSGELLFTPRVGSMYGYVLLWAMLIAVIFKWFINREVGRYTVCTGKTVIDGYANLPGPRHWALYLILIPQLFVAVSSIAGLAGSAATALIIALPGDIRIWTISSILLSTFLVLWGRFKTIQLIASILAITLALAAITAAITVFPAGNDLVKGLTFRIPKEVDYGELLPWLGFMLSGAAGMIWYSYWVKEKGYGAAIKDDQRDDNSIKEPTEKDQQHLLGWIRQMTNDNNVAVIGTLIVTLSFLILGAELLKPAGLVPEENKVAGTLGQLLGKIWGPIGFWFMIVAVFIGFWDTVLSDQDGFGRMFGGGIHLINKKLNIKKKWNNEAFLRKLAVVFIVTIFPIILYLLVGEPVGLLKIAGAIEAAHIPIVTFLTLYLNYKELPPGLKPGWFSIIPTILAGLFFAVFAVIFVLQISGIIDL
jgi:Mn2+/Fe2+ NRAMP family transporter